MAASIIVVEDDLPVALHLIKALRNEGFNVQHSPTERQARAVLRAGPCDLALLDLNLPDGDGLDLLVLCRELSISVLVLTARSDLDTRLAAFELGATDYVAKPFFVEEIVARVHARLGQGRAEGSSICWGTTTMSLTERTVVVDGTDVGLTAVEFSVLEYLACRMGRPISRAQLAEHALPMGALKSERTVDSHVGRIRKKLASEGRNIQTVWGIGYRLRASS